MSKYSSQWHSADFYLHAWRKTGLTHAFPPQAVLQHHLPGSHGLLGEHEMPQIPTGARSSLLGQPLWSLPVKT